MSLSTTTTTTTFELVKYSRAYNQSTNSAASQSDLEWQHFSNPVIRLTLDIKKSPAGKLESYRVRIVWSFGAGANAMDVDERDVVFEDLDLVAYSALPSLQAPLGMPLKAVYQAATIGLRYQFPRVAPPGQTLQYRRFQVAFLTESAATAFIDSIRFICPCKANPGPPARMSRPNPTQSNTILQSHASMTTHTTMSVARPSVTLRQSASAMAVDEPALPSLPPASVRRNHTMLPVSDPSICHSDWGDVGRTRPTISQEHRAVTTPSSRARAPSPINDYDVSRPSSAVTISSAIAQHSSSGPSSDSQPGLCKDRTRNIPVTALSDPAWPTPPSQRRRKEMFAQGSSSSDVDTSLPGPSIPSSFLPASSPPPSVDMDVSPASVLLLVLHSNPISP
ncbi:hypothetical protein C8Q80DRAFT_887487 [Daedaleopsis nitida]|nr:hypothetical protein C8Q80DRAFT_887487 [Daedaleopsis nitida]